MLIFFFTFHKKFGLIIKKFNFAIGSCPDSVAKFHPTILRNETHLKVRIKK